MKSQHLAISFDEFERMPHPFGWKAEYYNGKAHFTPRGYVVRTKLALPLSFVETTYFIQPLDSDYKLQMIQAFYEAFCHSVEFCDWTKKDIQKVLSMTTGIPSYDLEESETQKLKKLPKVLETQIIGQNQAIESVCNSIMRSKAGISNPNKPL